MQRIKNVYLIFHEFQKCPNKSRTHSLFKQQFVRSVKWDSLENQRTEFVKHLQRMLPLSYEQGIKILDEVPALRSANQMVLMKPNIDLLLAKKIEAKSIIENPFLLLMKHGIIEHKLGIIAKMSPKDVNDFLPLLELKLPVLKHIAQHATAERNIVPKENRIYFFSEKLKIDAHIVAKHFVKNVSIFTAAFGGIQKKLRILQDYNVPSLNILQSLYVFECSDQLLIKRLERFHSIGIVDIRLWTIKSSDENFEKYFNSIWKFSSGATNGMPYRSLRQIAKRERTQPPTERNRNANTVPTTYTEKSKIVAKLHDMLLCDAEEAVSIYYNHISYFDQLASAKKSISYLNENQIDKRSILDNPFLLTMDVDEIQVKLKIINEMQPKSLIDFVPLLMIDTYKLAEIRDRWKTEAIYIEQKHRIYYFSEKLQIKPSIVSKAFAKHCSIFFCSFNLLAQKLDTLLLYNISGSDLLGCLVVFERSIDTISSKLKLLSANKNEQISTWMICCDLDYFKRLVEQRTEKKEILDNCNDIEEYLSKRLNWSPNQLDKFKISYPLLFKFSVLKLSDHIDYLLNEASYTIDDINRHIFIFRCNLFEIRCRINELSSLNYTAKLFLIASSSTVYLKKIEKLCKNAENGMEKFRLIERRVHEQKLSKRNQ